MPVCGHCLCKKCFKNNFKKEEGIKHFNCPTCGEPDFFKLSNQAQYMYLKLFIEMVRTVYENNTIVSFQVKANFEEDVYDNCLKAVAGFCFSVNPSVVWPSREVCSVYLYMYTNSVILFSLICL